MDTFERTKRSFIWNFFERIPSDVNKVRCTICGCILSRSGKGKHASNTSMNNHVKGKHYSEFSSMEKQHSKQKEEQISLPSSSSSAAHIQITLKESLKGTYNKWDINDSRAQDIHYSIGEMIAADGQPLSIVEDIGFKRLMTKLKPHYVLPSRKFFSENIIPSIYERCKLSIASSLKDITNISFTCDIWTCSYTNKSFFSWTAHWLTEDMDFQHAMLNVRYFPGHHTGAEIRNMITTLKELWNINDGMVHLIIRDGAANVTKGCNDVGIKSVTCFIHSVQLVVKSGLSSQRAISDMLVAAKNIVGHFNHSAVACSKFEKVQLDLSMNPKKLIQDVSTRWNSSYYMLKRLNELKRPLCLYMSENETSNLTTVQWQLLESVVKLLSPFEEITTLMSSNKSVISEVIPSIKTLLHFLEKESTDHFGCGTMKITLKNELEKKFTFMKNERKANENQQDIEEEIQDHLHYFMATAVDPRFKLSFYTEKYKCAIKKCLKLQALQLMHLDGSAVDIDNPPLKKIKMLDENTDDPEEIAPGKSSSIFWQCFDEIANVEERQQNNCNITSDIEYEEKVDKEIDTFLASEMLCKTESPFAWWKKYNKTLPILCKLAKKFLCAPSSSAYSEHIFSEAGQIYNNRRNALSPENVERLVFLHHNLQYNKFEY